MQVQNLFRDEDYVVNEKKNHFRRSLLEQAVIQGVRLVEADSEQLLLKRNIFCNCCFSIKSRKVQFVIYKNHDVIKKTQIKQDYFLFLSLSFMQISPVSITNLPTFYKMLYSFQLLQKFTTLDRVSNLLIAADYRAKLITVFFPPKLNYKFKHPNISNHIPPKVQIVYF